MKRGENFFASKEAKFNIFCIISLPNCVSGEKKTFLSIFLLNFRLTSILSLNFCLFHLRFCFRFLVFRIEVKCEIRLFFASKRKEILASISNFASEAKVRAHPSLYFWEVLHTINKKHRASDIHILVWIRIRILGSMLLTNGSGFKTPTKN
jgi:hypothetical protein